MRRIVVRLAAIFGVALTAAVLVLSNATARAGEPDWLPKVPHGRGKKCVADTAWMRRYHMTALLHHRHETVHEGIRTKRFDLTGCIDCHAVKGADGKPVSYASPKYFCRVCHDYAAVQIDCFECHASRPEPKSAATSKATPAHVAKTDAAVLAQFLGSLTK
jgi:[DsrC]-trisulfide reductase subunit J